MNVSFEWLQDFVAIDLTPAELRDLLTSRCATVDDLVPLRADLSPIVVGTVVEAQRHPDAERLTLTRVDDGSGQLLEVVCGAPNVRAGAKYPFARVGTTLPGGLTIEKRKIRGQHSHGMLCSARELQLGEDHEGILELETDAPPGTPLLQAMPVGDTILVLDVNPNRPDLLSHLGVAREVAAATGRPLDPLGHYRAHTEGDRLSERLRPFVEAAARGSDVLAELVERRESAGERVLNVRRLRVSGETSTVAAPITEGETGGVRVAIEDVAGCPRYLGAVIRGVKVGPSPAWLVRRLASVGVRSVNNIVDVTNFMLQGFGQPMHAFDLARLEGPAVIVRRAREGETLTTLDGVARTLDPSMTVIADAERAQAIAGVMGGRESEVTADTTDLFLEVAAFDARQVRLARKALGLSTDASYRFERGTDAHAADAWLAHAVMLILEVAGGSDEAPADVHPSPHVTDAVPLRVERVRRLLGEPVPANEIVRLLSSIGFRSEVAPGTEMLHRREELRVIPPTWRPDIQREVDLIEEVARLHGYDLFPSDLRPFRPGTTRDDPMWELGQRLRDMLVGEGLFEVRPMPFVSGGEHGHVRVANPLAENEAHLRRELLESLARRAEYNLSHLEGNVRLFEIGHTFAPGEGTMPREELRVAALIMGQRRPPHFTDPKPPAFDEWDAKYLGERIAAAAFPGSRSELTQDADALWSIRVDGEVRGQVRRVELDAPVWAAPAFGIELSVAELRSAPVAERGHAAWRSAKAGDDAGADAGATRVRRYRPLPATPPTEFDLALIVPKSVPAEHVERVLRTTAGELLERLELFDEYQGEGIPPDARSLAWRLTFRHPERTLSLKEVEGRRSKLLRTLESELGIRQRTS